MRNVTVIALLLTLGCAAKPPSRLIVDASAARTWAYDPAAAPTVEAAVAWHPAADFGGVAHGYALVEDPDAWMPATTTPATVATTTPDAPARLGEFSKGARFATVYGSTIFGDEGKGEMYLLHVGFGTHVKDYESISFDFFGGYVRSGIDDDGGVIGFDALYRNHFWRGEGDDWTIFFEGGLGLQQASTNFSGERHFNLRTRVGFGVTFAIDEDVRGFVGGTYQHISDAGIAGGGGGFDGPMLWGGVTFPF